MYKPMTVRICTLMCHKIDQITARHERAFFMMTSSNGNIFRVTGPLCGEFTGPGEFPTQRPVTRSFDVFFICVRINGWVNNHEAGDLSNRFWTYLSGLLHRHFGGRCDCRQKTQENMIDKMMPFPDHIFRWTSFHEIVWISITIALKFVPKGPIRNIPALVQIIAWHQSDDKPLPEQMIVS